MRKHGDVPIHLSCNAIHVIPTGMVHRKQEYLVWTKDHNGADKNAWKEVKMHIMHTKLWKWGKLVDARIVKANE